MASPTSSPSDGLASAPQRLPDPPVARWMRPLGRFLRIESASGIVLLVCTLIALALANSPWSAAYAEFWQTRVVLGAGPFELNKTLLLVVNDGLMTIFFFVVGLEIKRELVAGELRDPRKAALPVAAALGGMIAPACIYLALRSGRPGESGWGVPMATDIAFVVGFLALLGSRVPLGLKILLLSLAIADDIGAVLVIAVFYSSDMHLPMLGFAAAGFALTFFFNRIGVRRVSIYTLVGMAVWLAFLKSGVHPTVAGVLLGLMTPATAWVADRTLVDIAADVLNSLRLDADGKPEYHHRPLLEDLEMAARESTSPLERLEHLLHPWVAFLIMPLFALANAGVKVELAAFQHPVSWAVAASLVLGKPIGIVAFSYLAIKIGIARLPTGVNWKVMVGAGALAGIGFTMSLFIASLALEGEMLDAGKIGTLAGSTVSALVGSALLIFFLPARAVTSDLRLQPTAADRS